MPTKVSPKKRTASRVLPTWVIWGSIALLVAIVALIYFLSRISQNKIQPPTPTPSPTTSLPAEITVDEAYLLFGLKGITFLDLRPAADWKAYHVGKSINFSPEQLSSHLTELTRTDTIVIFDAFGGDTSQRAVMSLKQAGFPKVTMVKGGIDAWVQKRYPLIGTAPY